MNFDFIKQATEWVMEKVLPKATIFTGIFMAIGALSYAALTALKLPYFKLPETAHPVLTEIGKYAALFWGFLAVTTMISEMRRASKERVAIHAEQIRMNPAVDDISAIPAVQKEINRQTVEGASPNNK